MPDSLRFDWNISGNQAFSIHERKVNVLDMGLLGNGAFDNSVQLQKLINEASDEIVNIFYFPEGTYFFENTIYLKSNICIQGEGAVRTKFLFDLRGKGHLFEISAPQSESFFPILGGHQLHSKEVFSDSVLLKNEYYELLINGKGLATSDWAMNSIGQILKCESSSDKKAYFTTELALNYSLYENARIRHIRPIFNVHFKNFSLQRLDATPGQTHNFNFYYAAHCSVVGVESFKSNMSHVSINKSFHCKVADSYIHHAFDYGGGGKAYGVELSFSSSHCLIENCIFENLRHSILLQAGANTNVISGNYSLNPFWKEGFFPSNSAGEIVLHGNYPFANLFEGNELGNIVVDNSHGQNGPGNLFFRNRTNNWGIFMNTGAGNRTHFLANENTGKLNNMTGEGNYLLSNYLPSENPKTPLIEPSLYLIQNPYWWPSFKTYPAIGFPLSNRNSGIPARYRYDHVALRALSVGEDEFSINYVPRFELSENKIIAVFSGNLQWNVKSITLQKADSAQSNWSDMGHNFSNNTLFQKDSVVETFDLDKGSGCYRWVVEGINKQRVISDATCIDATQYSRKNNTGTGALYFYPNPCSKSLNFNLTSEAEIYIYNAIGTLVSTEKIHKDKSVIDLSFLPNGSYQVKRVDNHQVKTAPLVILH